MINFLLTPAPDKQTMEAIYTQAPYDLKKQILSRGIVTDPKDLKKLKSSDRFRTTDPSGISPRWLPGAVAATYNAQGDEHSPDGSVDESAANAKAQIEKRMRKMQTLKGELPEPDVYGSGTDLLVVGWGSTKSVMEDVLASDECKGKVSYLHYTNLWPLKTEKLQTLMKKAKKIVLVEGNYQGQLGVLIKQECGMSIDDKILKYDGRPFFYEELHDAISSRLS